MSEKPTNIWTIAEAANGKLKPVSFELLARGRSLADACGEQLVSVLIGDNVSDVELRTLIHHGADLVISVQDPSLATFIVETYSNLLIDLVRQLRPNIILAAATNNGRTLMPHAAMRLHTGLTADCTDLQIDLATGDLLQTRPAIGGNILATIKTPNHRPQMATVRPRSTQPLPGDASRVGEIRHVTLKPELVDKRVKLLSFKAESTDESNLQESDVIISGGRGMKKADNFKLLHDLARLLGGKVGASRDAVDRGWARYPQQVGLSGKTVLPKLYIAFGISGAIQHLAGMKTAETIVAVNTDPNAAIFQVADFGIVGDAFQVLPELISRLEEKKS